jgi:hypothetical protein
LKSFPKEQPIFINAAATIYVSPAGNDSNPGSPDKPVAAAVQPFTNLRLRRRHFCGLSVISAAALSNCAAHDFASILCLILLPQKRILFVNHCLLAAARTPVCQRIFA